jgi:hypothetical protein
MLLRRLENLLTQADTFAVPSDSGITLSQVGKHACRIGPVAITHRKVEYRWRCHGDSRQKGSLTGAPAAMVGQVGIQRGGWSLGGSPSQ